MRGDERTADRCPPESLQDRHSQAPGTPESLDAARVVLRGYDPETDEGFLYSSWRHGLFYHTEPRKKGPPDLFYRDSTRLIRKILKNADVLIACLQDSPIVITGYAAFSGTHLNWIYVKEDYRGRGIGRLLWSRKHIETVTDRFTRVGSVLIHKLQLKIAPDQPGE